ncbi:MAG: toll/interleukin-1 receptor domain-containing protein [Candidatus Brocadiales bacterium]|nr:toll/interleukin-1 receptor domain-containing protein [Candidatus Brocadiales bacterium]
MPIHLNSLRMASSRYQSTIITKSFSEAHRLRQQTAFLCHSHADEDLVKGLQVLLKENGWNLYIDWQDNKMPDKPSRETAQRIQKKIRELEWFLFLATPNSTVSKWCPWEIGYADHEKNTDNILIIPTRDYSGNWYGNEYLQLYRQVTETDQGLAAFSAGKTTGGTLVKYL